MVVEKKIQSVIFTCFIGGMAVAIQGLIPRRYQIRVPTYIEVTSAIGMICSVDIVRRVFERLLLAQSRKKASVDEERKMVIK